MIASNPTNLPSQSSTSYHNVDTDARDSTTGNEDADVEAHFAENLCVPSPQPNSFHSSFSIGLSDPSQCRRLIEKLDLKVSKLSLLELFDWDLVPSSPLIRFDPKVHKDEMKHLKNNPRAWFSDYFKLLSMNLEISCANYFSHALSDYMLPHLPMIV